MASQLVNFHQRWQDTPLAVIDTETTGLRTTDKAVDIAIARFERGKLVAQATSLINPGMPIPAEATAIHGITDAMVQGMPTIDEWFALPDVAALLLGAQPAAYNEQYDRRYVPLDAFGDPSWPWIDVMSFVTKVDAFAKGKGRHKLGASCERHGVVFDGAAHRALPDAVATGKLMHVLIPKIKVTPTDRFGNPLAPRELRSIGELAFWTQKQRVERSEEFHAWLAKQPPLPTEQQQASA